MSRETMVAAGDHVRAVGWLSAEHPYARGTVPSEFLDRRCDFVDLASERADALELPLLMGLHTREFCGQVHDYRNFGIPTRSWLYVAPAMIGHYVQHHGYAPPQDFIAAVMSCPLPATPEYRALTLSFRELQQTWHETRQRI